MSDKYGHVPFPPDLPGIVGNMWNCRALSGYLPADLADRAIPTCRIRQPMSELYLIPEFSDKSDIAGFDQTFQ